MAWTGLLGAHILSFFVALLALVYIGFFSRFISDDYCTAATIQTHGFFGAQKYWFTTWQGRFSFTLIISAIHLVGSRIVPFITGIIIGVWLLALMWTLLQLSRTFSYEQPTVAYLFLAELIIISTLATSPALYQSLYWATGAVTYVAPLILLTIYIGLVGRIARMSRPGVWHLLLCGAISFVAAGFSETYAALQGGGLCLAILLVMTGSDLLRKRTLPLLIVGLGATILACIISVSAPGNEARIASSVSRSIGLPPRDLVSFIELSLRFGFDSVMISILTSRLTIAGAALVLPALLAFKLHSQTRTRSSPPDSRFNKSKWLVLLPVAGFVLIVFCFVPTAYVAAYIRGGYHPQPRLFVTSQFVFFCITCLWSYLAGAALKETRVIGNAGVSRHLMRLSLALVALLLVVPFNTIRHALGLRSTVRTFAARWDIQDQEIRAARLKGSRNLTVSALPSTDHNSRGNTLYFGLSLMDSNPDNWVNGCAASYYAVDSIVAK